MINETLERIEKELTASESLSEQRRRELLELMGTLKAEVQELARSNEEQARSIAGFTQVSTHEATRATRDDALLDLSLKGLSSSVAGFEQSHPRLVQIVNSISHTLSNLGI